MGNYGEMITVYECLEKILGKTCVREIASQYDSNLSSFEMLANCDTYQLTNSQKSKVKALQALLKKYLKGEENDRPIIFNSYKSIEAYCQDMKYLDHEEMRILYLDISLQLLKSETLFIGGIDGCSVDNKVIARKMLSIPRCSQVILVHNHPSGNAEPSQADIELTRRFLKLCKTIDFRLVDHVIIGKYNTESIRGYADSNNIRIGW